MRRPEMQRIQCPAAIFDERDDIALRQVKILNAFSKLPSRVTKFHSFFLAISWLR